MDDPADSRPYMPGYGTLGPAGGTGLLPWSWAEERLATSHDYWVATVRPDGRPHVMPVWGVWLEGKVWFRVRPAWVFGLVEADSGGSPTRWVFPTG